MPKSLCLFELRQMGLRETGLRAEVQRQRRVVPRGSTVFVTSTWEPQRMGVAMEQRQQVKRVFLRVRCSPFWVLDGPLSQSGARQSFVVNPLLQDSCLEGLIYSLLAQILW
jgi:hypothetical protein